MKLSELKIKSFVTGLEDGKANTAKGGTMGVSNPVLCMAGQTDEGEPGCGPDTNNTLDGRPGCGFSQYVTNCTLW